MIRILNVEPKNYSPQAKQVLASLGDLTEKEVSREELIGMIGDYNVLMVRLAHQIDREILARAPNLKIVVSPTTGLDHIDLDCARERGIRILSLKGETEFLNNITATAEHAWALLLSLVRKLPHAFQDVLRGNWERDLHRGRELKEKNLGIIGHGRLGRMVAEYGRAFRMKTHVHDPHVSDVQSDLEYVSLDQLLRLSDVVTLHLPFSEETKHLIDRKQFHLMKSNAVLINTSRGGIIHEKALLEALQSGQIAGAALDVLEGETEFRMQNSSWPKNDPLVEYARNHDNLILTPHLGGATQDSIEATEFFMVHQLRNYIRSNQS